MAENRDDYSAHDFGDDRSRTAGEGKEWGRAGIGCMRGVRA